MSGISGLSLIGSMVLSTAKIAQSVPVESVKAQNMSAEIPINAGEAEDVPDNGAVLTEDRHLNLEV